MAICPACRLPIFLEFASPEDVYGWRPSTITLHKGGTAITCDLLHDNHRLWLMAKQVKADQHPEVMSDGAPVMAWLGCGTR